MKALSSKLLTIACATALLLSFSGSADAQELMLSKGTKSIGGRLTVDIDYNKPSGGTGSTTASLNGNVTLGYFFADNIRGALSLGTLFPFNKGLNKEFNAGIGVDYFFSGMGKMVPFFGARLGVTTITSANPITDDSSTSIGTALAIPFGVLFPLSNHVALSLGAEPTFDILLSGNKGFHMKAPIGFLGVEAFF